MKRSGTCHALLGIVAASAALLAAAFPSAAAEQRDLGPAAEPHWLGSPFRLSDSGAAEADAAVAASRSDRPVFLVVWRTRDRPSPRILGRVVAAPVVPEGVFPPTESRPMLGAVKEIRLAESGDVEPPSAVRTADDEFLVTWAEGSGAAWAATVRVDALRKRVSVTSPAARHRAEPGAAGAAAHPDGSFLTVWQEASGVFGRFDRVLGQPAPGGRRFRIASGGLHPHGGGAACAGDGWCLVASDREGDVYGTLIYRQP